MAHAYYGPEFSNTEIGAAIEARKAEIDAQQCSVARVADESLLIQEAVKDEPVVCRPEEALDCFLRTKIDVLVMGGWFLSRDQS